MNQNPYQPIAGEVTDIIDESATIKTFVVVPEEELSLIHISEPTRPY